MKPISEKILQELEDYLRAQGFSGDIPQNSGHKNWQVIKKLMKAQPFYTFGIKEVEQAVKSRQVNAQAIRDIMVTSTGISDERFRREGPGHFSSRKVAERLAEAMAEIWQRSEGGQRLVFATGHPGSMPGFLDELANWAETAGAAIATIDRAVSVSTQAKLDMIGRVLVASDGCSVQHTHDYVYMEEFLRTHEVDLVVADHGFTGAALNQRVPAIGFYDTDDPAIPLAEALGMPVLAVPFNDNNYNANGRSLAHYIIERFAPHAAAKPRRPRTRAN